ncbi:MAG: septum formation initiator family protein [Deferribacteraceae bacterium]|jgi:cell division protein FtsB|nr:septum formation initiator family protein [Deferribacteraceae bacterium]
MPQDVAINGRQAKRLNAVAAYRKAGLPPRIKPRVRSSAQDVPTEQETMKLTAVYLAIIAGLCFYLVFGHNGLLKYNEMVQVQRVYEAQVVTMEEKIDYLERELDLMNKNNDYLEYVIRRELGLQKPDEDQYILTDNATISSQ